MPIYKDRMSRAKAIGILIVQVLICFAVGAWVFMQTFSVAGCGDSCDYGLVSVAWHAQLWVSVGVPVVSLISIILLYERGKDSWWVPTVGIGVVLITGIACTVAINIGTAS